jgi:hypothetical protein
MDRPEDYPRNTSQVNAYLRRSGRGEYKLLQGDGYLYFFGPGTSGWPTSSVMVPRVSSLTLKRWLEELEFFLQDESNRR